VPTELPQSGIQPDDTPRRPAHTAARPSRFRDDQFETEFRPGPRKYKVRKVGLDLGKGEPTAVQQEEQPHVKSKTPAGQGCQALGKGEPNRTTQCSSNQGESAKDSSIQTSSDSHLYLLRKRGHRLGWPAWPKVRFKSHIQSRRKARFRTLSRRSVRFRPPTGSCKLSRDTCRVRTLKQHCVIRFRTHYLPLARKKQHPLLRPTEMVPKNPSNVETSRVRTLNRSVSEAVSNMHHIPALPPQAQAQCGKPDASHMYMSDGVKDGTQYIQTVWKEIYRVNTPLIFL